MLTPVARCVLPALPGGLPWPHAAWQATRTTAAPAPAPQLAVMPRRWWRPRVPVPPWVCAHPRGRSAVAAAAPVAVAVTVPRARARVLGVAAEDALGEARLYLCGSPTRRRCSRRCSWTAGHAHRGGAAIVLSPPFGGDPRTPAGWTPAAIARRRCCQRRRCRRTRRRWLCCRQETRRGWTTATTPGAQAVVDSALHAHGHRLRPRHRLQRCRQRPVATETTASRRAAPRCRAKAVQTQPVSPGHEAASPWAGEAPSRPHGWTLVAQHACGQ